MSGKRFEGWYFKHTIGGETVAFIPGRADSGAFVQVIDSERSRHFDIRRMSIQKGVIYADGCVFSRRGAKIDLPGMSGELFYGALTPLRSDFMGPFRFFPMECRHGVVSMRHQVSGSLTLDGREIAMNGGVGYIETDSGTSFPSRYTWLQRSDPHEKNAVMLSIARIPFAGLHFTGCICAVICGGREYRLATYRGVRIAEHSPDRILLRQGGLTLEALILESHTGHPLRSPMRGSMSGMIRECNRTRARVRLWEKGQLVLDMQGDDFGFEDTVPYAQT